MGDRKKRGPRPVSNFNSRPAPPHIGLARHHQRAAEHRHAYIILVRREPARHADVDQCVNDVEGAEYNERHGAGDEE